jgi:hypothetical protein
VLETSLGAISTPERPRPLSVPEDAAALTPPPAPNTHVEAGSIGFGVWGLGFRARPPAALSSRVAAWNVV